MKLKEATDCFPSIKDWEDSYLKPGGEQRILGEGKDIQVEIMLAKDIIKVSVFFVSVTPEMLELLNLVSGSVEVSLEYLKRASSYAAQTPNVHHQEALGCFSLTMCQIRLSDAGTNYLVIEPAG